MSSRRRMMLAAFVAGWLAPWCPAAEPARLGLVDGAPLPPAVAPNQQLADSIASHLRQSGQLRGYSVDLVVIGGAVEVAGTVSSQPQREEVLRIVQGVPGVVRVVDRLRSVEPLTRVQGLQGPEAVPGTLPGGIGGNLPPAQGEPLPVVPREAGGGTTIPPISTQPPLAAPIPGGPIPGGPIPGGPIPGGPIPGGQFPGNPAVGGQPEPTPIFQAPGLGYQAMNPPRMPPYAWPTYAPYNNYSRVAYPEAYPYNAWPFIGPIHPFPKVPLGWRSVKLEWDDGYWWFSRTATKYDWWRLRFF